MTFSRPVFNPLLAIHSLGNNGQIASLVFAGQPFTVQSGGPSAENSGYSLIAAGDKVLGRESNGTVQFTGLFSSISWTNPTAEPYAFTIGIPLQPPLAPTGLAATPASRQVTLNWNASVSAASYNVYQSTSASDPAPVLVKSAITTLNTVITALTNDTAYYFRVAGVNAGGTGGRSAQVSATPAPSISINDVSIVEGNSGTKNLTFTVSMSRAVTFPVSVAYATANGTATAGSDYFAKSGTLNFPVGTTSQTAIIVISGDTLAEANETLFVKLANAAGASIADPQGQGTITTDD